MVSFPAPAPRRDCIDSDFLEAAGVTGRVGLAIERWLGVGGRRAGNG